MSNKFHAAVHSCSLILSLTLNFVVHAKTVDPPNPRHSVLHCSSVLQACAYKFEPVPISYASESTTAPDFPPAQIRYAAADKRTVSVTLHALSNGYSNVLC